MAVDSVYLVAEYEKCFDYEVVVKIFDYKTVVKLPKVLYDIVLLCNLQITIKCSVL